VYPAGPEPIIKHFTFSIADIFVIFIRGSKVRHSV
jgi:hypothetical protein